jgi:hypothetical protein
MTPSDQPQAPRGHTRLGARIPVTVEMVHVWEGSQAGSAQGTIFNVSRGGAAVRVGWVLPPRTRLRILVPGVPVSLHLAAEVIWTSLLPGAASRGAVYGVRWMEELSRKSLEAILPPGATPVPERPRRA